MKNFPKFFSAFLLLVFGWLFALQSHAEGELEAKVKAAYLFHITKFVEWPLLSADKLRICVIGNDEVGKLLLELSGRKVQERALQIEVNTALDPASCQVLYISRSEKKTDILMRLRGASVLTVSDQDDFARKGGIVGFYQEGGKIKLEINPLAARAANLKISSKLLELSRVVPTAQE